MTEQIKDIHRVLNFETNRAPPSCLRDAENGWIIMTFE